MARITASDTLHRGWTRLLRLSLENRGRAFTREVEDHGDAAAVLPYDPERRVALLVRLLRAPMLLRGAPESLEAPAGLAEDSSFAEAAAREAEEEAGVRLGDLAEVATVWTSPGISTERMALFLASYSTRDRTGPGGGLPEEHEDIEVVEMPLDALWRMVEVGELADHKTLTLVLALRQRHPELFGADATSGACRHAEP